MAAHAAPATTGIDQAFIDEASAALHSDSRFRVAMNAVTRNNPQEVTIDRAIASRISDVFSVQLDCENTCADQKNSGRCWLFAWLNCIRRDLIKKHGLSSDFELSQSHLFFWDKLSRCDYFLETMIATIDEPRDGRLVFHLLGDPINDGGQYDMLVNVINRYGLMPKSVWPEAWSSTSTGKMNSLLKELLRGGAAELAAIAESHKGTSFAEKAAMGDALRTAKRALMVEIYRVLCIHLGEPVFKFDWQFAKKDKTGFTRHEGLTPQSFARDICQVNMDDYVSLIHDPRNEYFKRYTVAHLGNVWGGNPIRYINVPIEVLKAHAKARLEAGNPVWFGCDVGKDYYRESGWLDTEVFQTSLVMGTRPRADKKTRLLTRDSLMTHAMVFTGVDIRGARTPARWRVENSWGKERADGYLNMSDAWFSEFVYQIVVSKSELAADVAAVVDSPLVVLPAWDPMGSLAMSE